MKRALLLGAFLLPVCGHALNFGGGQSGGSSGSSSSYLLSGDPDTGVASGGSNVLDLKAGGSTVVQITTTPGNGKLLLPNATISERPSIASQGFPTTGLHLGNTTVDVVIGNTVTAQFNKSGDGYFNFVPMGSSRKDGDGHLNPTIASEVNGDGITFVDNRLPDGVVGHDSNGRFVDIEIADEVNFRVGISSVGVNTGTAALGGTLAIGASNAQFVVMGSTATGSNTVSIGTGNSPAAASSAPKWIRLRLCNTAGANCANYFMPIWAE